MTRTRLPAIGALLSVLILAAPVSAAPPEAADISGAWRFKTSVFDDDCVMSGGISLAPPAKAGAYTCSMIVETHCRNPQDGLYEYWRVRETCTGTRKGAALSVTGRIARMEEATWFGKRHPAADEPGYTADNFTVTIVSDSDMRGKLHDAIRRLDVRLWREEERLS